MEPNRSVINLYGGRINKDQMPLQQKQSGTKEKDREHASYNVPITYLQKQKNSSEVIVNAQARSSAVEE